MKWTAVIVILLGVTCFITNPKQRDYQFKANELFEQALNREADSGSTLAKVARFFGAGKKGDLIIRVERNDYLLFSTADVYSTFDNEPIGLLLGVLGQVYLIQ